MKDLKITKGECKTEYPITGDFIILSDGLIITKVLLNNGDLFEQEFNALLITDTFNTAQKCNLLPSELLEQRDELLEALNLFIVNGYQTPSNKDMNKAIEVYQTIKKEQQ